MGLKCGIVGLPNVGKSTLFNALTELAIDAENYPFCTIEPNVGMVEVNDPRLAQLAEIVNPQKIVPTTMEFVDIAGLVAGASKGEGLGNQFLANIRETNAIVHVVRCFDDDNITHVSSNIDPLSDVETINTELILADLATLEKVEQRLAKLKKSGESDAQKHSAVLTKINTALSDGRLINGLDLSDDEQSIIKPWQLLTAKPMLYVANVDEDTKKENAYLTAVYHYAKETGAQVVVICARLEAEIVELNEEDRRLFLADMGETESGLDRLIMATYKLLHLQTYFTAGEKEVRAWTTQVGDSAPRAAGKIHNDFERGFIRAETIAFDDFIACDGERGAREAGKLRSEGKEYVVQDGDVIHFLFNV